MSRRRRFHICIATSLALILVAQAAVCAQEIGSPEGIRSEQSLPSHRQHIQAWGPTAGLTEFTVTGEVAMSAEDPQVGQGVWLAFEKKSEVVARKEDDQVTAQVDGDSMVYTFTSPSGISGATISPPKGWPKRVVVRLRLRGLESFTASNGKVELRASVLSHSGHRRLLSVMDNGEEKKVAEDSPYWIAIKALDAKGKPVAGLPDKNGYFEIELPSALFHGKPKSLRLGWIDFYR